VNKYEKRLRRPYHLLSGTLKGNEHIHPLPERVTSTLIRAGQFLANPRAFIRWEKARRKQYQDELSKLPQL
jgi:hypothetical protein